ncbi:TetR/AcrR family transcriptional regulator [Aquabacterium sp. A08]|uniref:TetR/AcrR family transcriptional regulator n=1 Tax=Aquabacterium sp. A08 TaxID=2718532 RepID=UPI001423B2B7|nr:TetR/AcrR family transcriptional regulator [Aquabacterium sp. A08]NIC43067.1 TetR/AcrR family transcriptional regulator [Aquabacterium sp. A08]
MHAPSLPPTAPRRSRRKDARPGELLDAALDLFVEHGYAATRVEAVAQRAGVSKGTLFRYFPSKEDLFKAVVRQHLAGRIPEWHEEFAAFEGSSADMVRHCLQQWWARLGATRLSGLTKLVMTESAHFPEIARFYQAEVIAPANALLRQILERGVARGEFRPIDPDYGIYSLIAPMIFLLLWKHAMAPCIGPDQQIDPEAFLRSQTDALLHGLLAQPPAPDSAATAAFGKMDQI